MCVRCLLPSTIFPAAQQRRSMVISPAHSNVSYLTLISQAHYLYIHIIFWTESHTWSMSWTGKRQMTMTSRIKQSQSITGNTLLRRFSFSTQEVKLDLLRNYYSTTTHCSRGSVPSLNKIRYVTTTVVGVFWCCLDEVDQPWFTLEVRLTFWMHPDDSLYIISVIWDLRHQFSQTELCVWTNKACEAKPSVCIECAHMRNAYMPEFIRISSKTK